MMNNVILTIISLSISGSILFLIILALRPIYKNRVSKTFQYYIWLLVLIRLALPLSFDGSIMNRLISQTVLAQPQAVSTNVGGNGTQTQGPAIPQNNEQNAALNIVPSESTLNGNTIPSSNLSAAPETTRFNIWKFALEQLPFIWLLGGALYFGWFIIAYLRFNRKIRKTSIRPHAQDVEFFAELRGNKHVQLACNPYIDTPMLIGFLSPCIVIPHLAFVQNGMKSELSHILRHELTHYRRHDLIYKWLIVLISSLHWFNPLMILVRREISRACELSCDETVIRSLDVAQRQDYGETLLAIASDKRLPTGIVTTTMCEGKRELKERLESIMIYKNKGVLMVALSLFFTLLLTGCSVALGAANVTQIPDEASQSPAATATLSAVISDDKASQSPVATNLPDVSAMPDDEDSQSSEATATPSFQASPSAAPSAIKSETTKTTQTKTDNPVVEAYNAVVKNKAKFFSTDNKKELFLKDFLTNKEIYGTSFNVTHFAVLDMDNDKVPEVVLELSVGDEPQFYEVLHFINGTVKGYLVVYRGLEELKADGTFYFSNGAADNGWGKLRFGSNAYETNVLGYSQSNQGDTNLTVSYFINDKPATKESFDSFTNEQSGKKDAVWYEFTQKNFLTVNS